MLTKPMLREAARAFEQDDKPNQNAYLQALTTIHGHNPFMRMSSGEMASMDDLDQIPGSWGVTANRSMWGNKMQWTVTISSQCQGGKVSTKNSFAGRAVKRDNAVIAAIIYAAAAE